MKPLSALTFAAWLLGWILPSRGLVAWTSMAFILLAWALVARHILRKANAPGPRREPEVKLGPLLRVGGSIQ